MDTEEILERLRKNIKGDETKENIKERAEEIRTRLEKEVKKGPPRLSTQWLWRCLPFNSY